MSYKIGSFNCLNFARNSDKDIEAFAEIIRNEQFDIIALQEIKGIQALNRILALLPNNQWEGTADYIINDYAFVWNRKKIRLAESENDTSKVYQPRIYRQYKVDRKEGQMRLIRDPYFARFFPTGPVAPYIELRIINCHIRFNKSDNSLYDISTAQMRKNELDVLIKSIYAKESDKRYGNYRPAYTILLGDYNLNCRASSAGFPYLQEIIEVKDGIIEKKICTQQIQLTTLKNQLEEADNPFVSNYDHFSYDLKRFDSVSIQFRRIEAVEEYYNSDYKEYKKNVSDHVPIEMNLNLKRE